MKLTVFDIKKIWLYLYINLEELEIKYKEKTVIVCNLDVLGDSFLYGKKSINYYNVLKYLWNLTRIIFLNRHFWSSPSSAFVLKNNKIEKTDFYLFNFEIYTLGEKTKQKFIKLLNQSSGLIYYTRTGSYFPYAETDINAKYKQVPGPRINFIDFINNFTMFILTAKTAYISLRPYYISIIDKMTIALYIAYTYVSVVQWFLTVIKPMQLSMMFVDENDCFDNRIVSFCCKKNNCLVLSNQHGYNVFRSHPDKYMSDFRISYGQNLGLVPLKNCYGKKIISFCNIETKNKKVYVEKKMEKCCFIFSLPKKNIKYYIAISFINSLIKECIKIAKRFGVQYDFKFHPNTLSIKKDLDFCGLPIIPDFSRSSPDVFNKYDFCVFPECVSSLMILIGKQNIPCLFVNFGISNWHEHNEIYFLNISGFGPYTPDNLEHEFNNNFKDHIKRQQLYVSKYFNYDHSL